MVPLSRANMTHIRQSRPGSGHGFQVNVLKTFKVVPSSLGSVMRPDLGSGGVQRRWPRPQIMRLPAFGGEAPPFSSPEETTLEVSRMFI